MAVRINFNEAAAQTHTALIRNERFMNKSLLRLSTGYRILSAADDSAGLFISDMLDTVARAYDQGNKNIQTGMSALQIAESAAGQIYEKLQEIYVRAENAANDINDPNARSALQQEIRNFVDVIQKIGTDTEYNGIKLLDGTFTDKYIHYGPRMQQTVRLSIDSLKARDLGAYMIAATGKTSSSNVSATALGGEFVQSATSPITVTIGGRVLNASTVLSSTYNMTDVGILAYNINHQLYDIDFEAKAVNVSIADEYHAIADVNASATLTFYVGKVGSSSAVSFSFTVNTTVTLDELVEKINREAATAGAPLNAKAENGRLVLETEHGESIALEVSLASATGTINLNQLIEGASAQASATLASAVKVGDIYIARPEDMGTASTDISLTNIDGTLNFSIGSATDDEFKDLYAIDVRSNTGAEIGLMIAKVALQRVDTVRAQIGATINNLQSIFDAQKVAYDNTKQAESVIRNTDYAEEMSNFTTYQIRMQSTIAMLAQANS